MKTIKKGTKLVNIIKSDNIFRSFYCQVYKGEQQVLDTKDYMSLNMAEKWAKRKLN